MAQRITTAVRVQLTTVSKNTSKIAHWPWTPGSPSAAPLRTARLPSPASLEKTPRAIPYWTLLLARSPTAPPTVLRNENASWKIIPKAEGIFSRNKNSTAAEAAI